MSNLSIYILIFCVYVVLLFIYSLIISIDKRIHGIYFLFHAEELDSDEFEAFVNAVERVCDENDS